MVATPAKPIRRSSIALLGNRMGGAQCGRVREWPLPLFCRGRISRIRKRTHDAPTVVLVIVGSGDHARVVVDVANAIGDPPVGYLSKEPAVYELPGVPRLGDLDSELAWLQTHRGANYVVAIGDNRIRAREYEHAASRGLRPVRLVHPTALLLGGANVGSGSQICAGAIVGVNADIRADVIVNTGAIVDHDVVVNQHAFIGPGARLAGRVVVENGAHVGIGAVVREGCTIGAWATVGAGAAVIADIPPGARVGGVPAKPLSRTAEAT